MAVPAAGAGAATSAPSVHSPVDIVIAVDESYSIRPSEMAAEQQAARTIALGEFSAQSRVEVLGFGGDNKNYNRTTNPQVPFDVVCPMTEVSSAASRQGLSDCIGKLRKRTPAEGDHTDFISVIGQAVSDLQETGGTGRPLLLFLLTDGQLDVVGSPNFPKPGTETNAQINRAGQQQLFGQTLPQARSAHVRIWPLGFGPAVNRKELAKIAARGYQGKGACPEGKPTAVTIASADQLQLEDTLQAIFAGARCAKYTKGSSGTLRAGQSLDLQVDVPVLATQGTIEVIKQDPRVQVSFTDPNGHSVPTSGSYDNSTFQLAGASSPVAALAVSNPLPGKWTVHLSAPPGLPDLLVIASVLWQGVLHSDLTITPGEPKPGQTVDVQVRLQVRRQLLAPTDLAGIQVSATVTGDGIPAPVTATLNDNGSFPDATSDDGIYTGQIVIPASATGTLNFTTRVTGPGVIGDRRQFSARVATSGLLLTGQMVIPSVVIHRGEGVPGTLQLTNQTGKTHTIRLTLVDAPPGVTISPATLVVPQNSGTTNFPVTVHIGDSVPVGALTGHVQAVDTADGSLYASAYLLLHVQVAPKWYQHWYVILGFAVLALLAVAIGIAFYLVVRARREWANVEQIEIVLYNGSREIEAMQAPAGSGSKFSFSVDRSRPDNPRLQADFGEPGEYVARRWRSNRRGQDGLEVRQQGAEPQRLDQPDVPIMALSDGTALGFRDLRLADLPPAFPPDDPPLVGTDYDAEQPGSRNGHGNRRWWSLFASEPSTDDVDEPYNTLD